MPNWTKNTVIASKAVIDRLINEKGEVELGLIIPEPGDADTAAEFDWDWDNSVPNVSADWYWDNWGTNKIAFETKRYSDKCVFFETAWKSPWPVLFELSKLAGEAVVVEYLDEREVYETLYTVTIQPDGSHTKASEPSGYGPV